MAAEMDSGADILQLASHRDVLKILECPVCMEVPFPPIFNCVKGHIVCHICRPKLKECVMCKENFSEGRNFVAESIVLSSKHICKFKHFGCGVQQDGHSMAEHIKVCEFKNGPISKPIQIKPNSVDKIPVPPPLPERKEEENIVVNNVTKMVQKITFTDSNIPAANPEYEDWTHAKLKMYIEASNSPKVVEECRSEVRRRLLLGLTKQVKSASVIQTQAQAQQGHKYLPTRSASLDVTPSTQRPLPNKVLIHRTESASEKQSPVPSAPPLAEADTETPSRNTFIRINLTNPIGFWYAHFCGENVVRQMEFRQGSKPILMWIGSEMAHNMFELKLSESGLLEEVEAIISKECFEAEWVKAGGKPQR